jgi:hypothetical protein
MGLFSPEGEERLTSPEGNAIQRDMYQYYDIYLKSALAASDEKNLSHQWNRRN